MQSNCKKQRNIRMILLGLMLVFSISCQDRTTSRQQSDYCDFESFNHPRIFIKYKQPVNGYTVKIMWFQYGEIGNALFRLEKNGKVHYLFVEKWNDKFLYDKYCNDNIKYPNDTIIELNYIPKLDSEKYLSDNSPFFFLQSPNQKIPDRKTKCVIKTHINIKQNVIFGAKLKPV